MQKTSQRDKIPLTIFSTLNIPTVTSHPSLKTVQWSADGQLAFVTKNAVIILTPDHGINVDNDSTIKATPNKEDPALGWFKTMIQHDQAIPIKWPDYSQTWSAVSLGSIDLTVVSLTTSPSGLSPYGRCIYATLSSNMDVNLWMGSKNYLKGEWLKIFEVTPYLLHTVAPTPEEKCTAAAVLQAQVVSIEWTPQVDFGFQPAPCIDASLLILGTRSGHLSFLRYREGVAPSFITSLHVSDNWITQLSFAKWVQREPGIHEGVLAYGAAGGAVGCVNVVQALTLRDDGFTFTPIYDITVTMEPEVVLVHNPTVPVSTTGLRWVHVPGRSPILVTTNPGQVNFWAAHDPTLWNGHRSLRIKNQRTCTDSSPFHPVAGITYVPAGDRLVVTLLDGSFHVIRHLSTNPEWASTEDVGASVEANTNVHEGASAGGMTDNGNEIGGPVFVNDKGSGQVNTEVLSRTCRAIFEQAEKGDVDRNDMARIDGVVRYDGNPTFLWVYESSRPSDFSYKHDAKHSSTLVVAQLWEQGDADPLRELYKLLKNVKTSSRQSPLHHLRPVLVHLRDPAKLTPLLIEILRPDLQTDHSLNVRPLVLDGPLDPDGKIRARFRVGLAADLFGWDHLLELRMRLSLADFAWKVTNSEERRAAFGVVAQTLLSAISHRVLRTLTRYLLAVVGALTPADIPFVSRIILQSLLRDVPADLAAEGQVLSEQIAPLLEAEASAQAAEAGEGDGGGGEEGTGDGRKAVVLRSLDELCPACGVAVPLQDITTATCANGHTWPRCSVTTFILSTAAVRTCVGCSRKAFLPPSAKRNLPDIARGWVVEELLEAVHHCLFCNNGFISIL